MEGDGATPKVTNLTDDACVNLLEERLDDDVKSGIVRVASSEDFARLDAGDLHGAVDGLAATMDEDGAHADGFHEDDVLQRGVQGIGVFHGAAAQLDDGQAVAKVADVTERLDEGFG